ncbi:glutathione S-transferase family protein [Gammaproteobacteria bacterium]|nr:glutathione S-transferase family protein [Gammaproteobacteria bacterium]
MKKAQPKAKQAWQNEWYDTTANEGRFVRTESRFRNWITADGSPGPTGIGGFKAVAGRYHLYVSLACPWAHRTLIYRKLKKLEDMISVSVTRPYMGPLSWSFEPEQGRIFYKESARQEPCAEDEYVEYLYELYQLVDPDYSGRATVPVLWDKHRQTIVSNESSEIVRMFNTEFNGIGASAIDLYPEALRQEIDDLNELIYPTVNNGVYKAGFATTQAAYEEAVWPIFDTLDKLEERLSQQRYLSGKQITEADIRLFPTLVRFDSVYVGHFKCGLKRIVDYPNLWGYTRDIYQLPGIADTVDIEHNKAHYYGSHDSVNPTLIIPVGPQLDFTLPHDRERF